MTIRHSYYKIQGGLDIESPPITVSPGSSLSMQNFEPWFKGGSRRIAGFERFDGRPAPSAATFKGFDLVDTTGLSLGDTLIGDSSTATGIVIGISDSSVAVTKVTGTFTQSETLNTSAYTMAATPIIGTSRAPTIALQQTFKLAAADEYRPDITTPAGVGEIRGIWQLRSKKFCIRNNTGGTAGVMYLASAAGWTTTGLTMTDSIYFDAGQTSGDTNIVEGATVTGLTSSASATVHRIILHSGAWDGSGKGYIVLTGVTGVFQNNEALQVGGTTYATANGANSTFSFPIDGHYQFINHNFFGGANTYRTYGCNGVGPAFEIDENETISPILLANSSITGQPAANTPKFIEEHRGYLFLGFPAGSLQHSVQGEPMQFNGFLGAAEFGMGDEITGINSMAGPVLVVTSERQTKGLFGKTTNDWEIKILGEQTGGKAYSTQKLDTIYAVDDLGITSLSRTDAFGDFVGASVSQQIQSLINSKKALVTCSVVNKASSQYRVYFSDNSALVLYSPVGSLNTRYGNARAPQVEFGLLRYDQPVNRIWNTEDENGVEVTYFASDDGLVYKDQIGSSFDGDAITSYNRLHFNHVGSPAWRKRFRKADLELDATVNTNLKFLADLSYASGDSAAVVENLTVEGGGGFWNDVNWDEFQWNSQTLSSATAKLTGTGDNIGFLIYNKSSKAEPFVLQGITLYYEPRRLKR